MSTEPQPPSLSEIVGRAAVVCDPGGANAGVVSLQQRFEDRDEPVTGVGRLEPELAEAVGAVDPQSEDPAVAMTSALILHLAHRRDQLVADPKQLLTQAARDEFAGAPPEHVQGWLAAQGVSV